MSMDKKPEKGMKGILETGLGWGGQEVFAVGLGGATFLAAALVLAALVRKPRQE